MRRFTSLLLVLLSISFTVPTHSFAGEMTAAEKAKKRQELLEKLKKVREEKAREAARNAEPVPSTASLSSSIGRFEKVLQGCSGDEKGFQKSICADAAYTLGKLYYDKAKDDYIQAQEAYEIRFEKWEKRPIGARPVPPIPDYSRSLKMYQRAVRDYPESNQLANGYFQIGGIFMLDGELDSAKAAYLELASRRPGSRLASAAHFRIGQINFTNHDMAGALLHLNKIRMQEVNPTIREMAHYRKSEVLYNTGALDSAAAWFGSYVDKCDMGEYPKAELRPEALEYMAVAFSDMPTGADAALSYFKSHGGRSYEDTVIYAVGFKNYDHGQFKQCIAALGTAIKKFPSFEDAPKAQTSIVNAYVISKQNELANQAREQLVTTYGKGSPWINSHASQPIIVAKAEAEVKRAISSIATYYHFLAQETETKDPAKAKGYYQKALDRYLKYISSYPEELWKAYEFNYAVGDIYSVLKDYELAAKYYDKVAAENLSKYPKYVQDIGDTVGMDDQLKEELRKEAAKSKGALGISQEEAGYNSIANLNLRREEQIKTQNLDKKASYALSSTKGFIDYIHKYQIRFPKAKEAPHVLFLAASVQFDGEDFSGAITDCEQILRTYPTLDTINWDVSKLLADAFAGNKQYDLAISKYDEIIRTNRKPDKKDILVTLASGTMYQKAESLRDGGNTNGAVEVFKSVRDKYPTSKFKDKAWFEAGMTLEKANQLDLAAATFLQLPTFFAGSELAVDAYGRASINYSNLKKYDKAADAFLGGARDANINDQATQMKFYGGAATLLKDSLKSYDKAGNVLMEAYAKFPMVEEAPKYLYNAGYSYETGKLYEKAISSYRQLSTKYPTSVDGLNGAYAIGYCYKEMGKKKEMAKAFADFAKTYVNDRPKQINALLLATDAYLELNNNKAAELNVTMATTIYEEYKEKAAISGEVGAKAYYILGKFNHDKVNRISLKKKSKKTVDANLKLKQKHLEPTIKAYTLSGQEMVEEWLFKSQLGMAKLYSDYAEALREKTAFGSEEDQIADKIKTLQLLPGFYDKSIAKLLEIISFAQQNGLDNDAVKEAKSLIMEYGFKKGYVFKEIGILYRDAPIPHDLDEEEQMVYSDELYNMYIQNMVESVPFYEEALGAARKLYLGNSEWTEKIKEELNLAIIETGGQIESNFKDIDLDAEKAAYEKEQASIEAQLARITTQEKAKLDKALAQIDRVYNSEEMPFEEKLTRLMGIETDAKKVIDEESKKIAELKTKLGIIQ